MSSPPQSPRSLSSNEDQDDINTFGEHSTSTLVLVHEGDNEASPLTYSDDDEEEGDVAFDIDDNTEQALPSAVVFGYFLAPCLKLGAMLTLSSHAPLKTSAPSLVLFALLSAFSRQIWFLLARYVRKPDAGTMAVQAFVRGQRKVSMRVVVRNVSRAFSSVTRLLLSAVYLRGAADSLEIYLADDNYIIPTPVLIVLAYMIFLVPLCLAQSFASKRLVYTNWLSIVLYVLWVVAVVFAHSQGVLDSNITIIPRGRLFQDITTIAFAFASLSSLQMYNVLVGPKPIGDKKERRHLSLSSTSLIASLVGFGMLMPLLFPSIKRGKHDEPEDDTSYIQAAVATLSSFILLLAIPPLMTNTSLPLPQQIRRITTRPIGKHLSLIVVAGLALLPSPAISVLEDITLLLVLISSYFLPALLHIILHHMRRPLSILVSASAQGPEANTSSHDADIHELLLRKERALQRRRSLRRIAWDLGVWFLLVPVGGGGLIWAVGRLTRAW